MPLVVFLLVTLVFLESSIVSIPLALTFLVCLMAIEKKRYVLILGFFSGLLLDILLLRQLGITALLIVLFLFSLMLYQRKFEIATYYFTAIATFIASLIYLLFFRIPHPFVQATVAAILAILFFTLLTRISVQKGGSHESLT